MPSSFLVLNNYTSHIFLLRVLCGGVIVWQMPNLLIAKKKCQG